MAGDGLALVFIVGVRSLGIDCRYRLDRPSLDLSAGVNLPPLSVPYQPLRPQMAVPKIVAVTDGQSLGVAEVGQVEPSRLPALGALGGRGWVARTAPVPPPEAGDLAGQS